MCARSRCIWVPLPIWDLEQLSVSIKIIFGDLYWLGFFFFWLLFFPWVSAVYLWHLWKPKSNTGADGWVAFPSRTCPTARTGRSSPSEGDIDLTSSVSHVRSCATSAFPLSFPFFQLWWEMCCTSVLLTHLPVKGLVGQHQPRLSGLQIPGSASYDEEKDLFGGCCGSMWNTCR